MQWASKKQAGFTIVELLIVIVVIAILAAITIVAYAGIQSRARDASRDSAADTIMKALELYAADNSGQYPNVCAGGVNSGCDAALLSSPLTPTYIASIPSDPDSSKVLSYVVSSGFTGYGLYVRYEAKTACKFLGGTNPQSGWWGSSVPAC